MGARDIRNACRSVLAVMNSMPSMPASIMRFTALPPPPPTPMTLILASLRGSSLKLMRIFESFLAESFFIFVPTLILDSLSRAQYLSFTLSFRTGPTPGEGPASQIFDIESHSAFASLATWYRLLVTTFSSHEQRLQPRSP